MKHCGKINNIPKITTIKYEYILNILYLTYSYKTPLQLTVYRSDMQQLYYGFVKNQLYGQRKEVA